MILTLQVKASGHPNWRNINHADTSIFNSKEDAIKYLEDFYKEYYQHWPQWRITET